MALKPCTVLHLCNCKLAPCMLIKSSNLTRAFHDVPGLRQSKSSVLHGNHSLGMLSLPLCSNLSKLLLSLYLGNIRERLSMPLLLCCTVRTGATSTTCCWTPFQTRASSTSTTPSQALTSQRAATRSKSQQRWGRTNSLRPLRGIFW